MSHQVKSIDFASRFQCFFLFVLCKSVIFAFFIARNISNWGTADLNRSKRIARTEGHSVQCKADLNCAYRARQMGCDTVKQWNAVLDGKTRESHRLVDKEWRELEEPFSNGLMYPKEPGAPAAERCNCRCILDDVPRWYVEKGGGRYRRDNNTGEIIKASNYQEWKEKYLNKLNHDDTIIFRSFDRKEKNSGAFSGLKVPMQKKAVKQVCNKYNYDISGSTIKIQRSESMLATFLYGSTDYDNIGRIDLFPNAFVDEEELIKTIIHEKCHVEHSRKYGKKYCQEHLSDMEKEAYNIQDEVFERLKKEVK